MKSLIICLFFTGFLSSCFCDIEFSDNLRSFSLELLHFTQLEAGGHIVLSPFGIWSLMTGVALGTTGNSYEQLKRAFILPNNPNTLIEGYKSLTKSVLDPTTPSVSLRSKNFLFLDNGLSIFPDFKNAIQNDFGSSIKVIDFNNPNSAAKLANSYIESSTGRLSNVLNPDDFIKSRMILTNVISFKGLWTYPFNKSETIRQTFYDENKRKVGEVNMMYQKAQIPFSNIEELKALVIELPYGNDGKYSMLFLLPRNGVKVAEMYKNFARISFKDVMQRLKDDEEEFGLEDIEVLIPRFQISTTVVLNKPLNHMGVYDIFVPDLASFQRATRDNIFVSAVVHKADIEVTESGTVASAETSAYFADRMSTPRFLANKPFVYFVIEKTTTTVIFGGIYSKPTIY